MVLNEKLFTNKLIEKLEENSNRVGVEAKADAIVEGLTHFYPNMEWVNKLNREDIKYLISNSKSDKALIESLYDRIHTSEEKKQKVAQKPKKLKESLDKDKLEEASGKLAKYQPELVKTLKKFENEIKEYGGLLANGKIKNAYKDFATRFVWDTAWALKRKGLLDFDKFYEEDANDSHIDTLLKQAFKGANISTSEEDYKGELSESLSLKENTSNFGYSKNFPLLVFLMDDEIEADDVDNEVCVLSDWDVEDLDEKLKEFNEETKDIAYELDVNDDGYQQYGDNLNLKDIELIIEPGYYSGAYIKVKNEKYLDNLSEEVKKEQMGRINNFLKELKDTYGLTRLNRDSVASNGEAFYSIVKEDLEKGIEKYLDIELEDGEGPYGGVSFDGETLRDFVEECDIDPKEWSLKDINDALKDCGIKPISPSIKEEWYGIDVDKEKAEKLKKFLRKSNIYFEPSENGTLTHFEIEVDKDDVKGMIDKHLSEGFEEDEDEQDYIAKANEFIDEIKNKMSEDEAKDWYYREYRFDTHKPEDEVEQKIADALKEKGKIVEKLIKEGYFDYMDKDYADVLDKDVDVYDIKQFVIDESEGQYRTHYADKYAIIVCPNGKGCIVDYEAVGQDFDSVDSKVSFGVEENKDNEYTDENGTKHRTINLMATHKMTTTPKELLEKASHTTMKYRDFFDKYNYNDRCAYNFKDLVEYIKGNGGLQEGCHLKKKDKKLKEGYIGQTLEDFFYDCVDPDIIGEVNLWGDDLVFEGSYEDAVEKYGDCQFHEFDCGADKVVINVDTSEDTQVLDYFVDVQDFLECFNGDEVEVFDINDGETLFSGDKYDIPDDVAEKIIVSFDAPNFISINIDVEEEDEDDDFDEGLKEDKKPLYRVVKDPKGKGYCILKRVNKKDKFINDHSKETFDTPEEAKKMLNNIDKLHFHIDEGLKKDLKESQTQEIEMINDRLAKKYGKEILDYMDEFVKQPENAKYVWKSGYDIIPDDVIERDYEDPKKYYDRDFKDFPQEIRDQNPYDAWVNDNRGYTTKKDNKYDYASRKPLIDYSDIMYTEKGWDSFAKWVKDNKGKDLGESLKEDKVPQDYTHVVYLHPGFGYQLYPFYVKCEGQGDCLQEAIERALCQAIDNGDEAFFVREEDVDDQFSPEDVEKLYDGKLDNWTYFDLSEYGDYPIVFVNLTETKVYPKDKDPWKDNYKEGLCECVSLEEIYNARGMAYYEYPKGSKCHVREVPSGFIATNEHGTTLGHTSKMRTGAESQIDDYLAKKDKKDIKEERRMSDGPLNIKKDQDK